MFKLTPQSEAAHRQLSPMSAEFLQYMNGKDFDPLLDDEEISLPAFTRFYPTTSWPLFLDQSILAEVKRATLGLDALLKSVPERLFGNNGQAIRSYLKVPEDYPLEENLKEPTGLDYSISRLDLVMTNSGFKCLESNNSSRLGGWQIPFYEEYLFKMPQFANFFKTNQFIPRCRDTLRLLFTHIAETCYARGIHENGEVNILIAGRPTAKNTLRQAFFYFNKVYARAQEDMGGLIRGRVLINNYDHEYELNDGYITIQGQRIHASLETTADYRPLSLLGSFRRGKLLLFNAPITAVLSKAMLGLLYENMDSEEFNAEERSIISSYIPWTARLTGSQASWNGETIKFPEDLYALRERLVLKASTGYGGEDVFIGNKTRPHKWNEAVDNALKLHDGQWIVQEYCESVPYTFPTGPGQVAEHDLVWGFFAFGRHYGGGFLRVAPRGNHNGVINAAQGALEGLILEKDPVDYSMTPLQANSISMDGV